MTVRRSFPPPGTIHNAAHVAAVPTAPRPSPSPTLCTASPPTVPAPFSHAEQSFADDSNANGPVATQAALFALPSDEQPPTPLSTKMLRRQQLMLQEHITGGEGELQSASCTPVEMGHSPSDSPIAAARTSLQLSFSSVAARLEEEDLNRNSMQQGHHHEAASSLLPIVTPRDAAVQIAPLTTPFVFSTMHLKSPSQVR